MSEKTKHTSSKKNELSLVASIFEWFQGLFQKTGQISIVPIMTYDDALKYFIQERPKNSPKIKKGAISRQKHSKGYLLAWAFLDQNEELVCDDKGNPYGRQLIAQKLDKELAETFGNSDLIIVQ
jgi:hypothetical protein